MCVLSLTAVYLMPSATHVEKYRADASSDLTELPSEMASMFYKPSAFSVENRENKNVYSYFKNSCPISNIPPKCKRTHSKAQFTPFG